MPAWDGLVRVLVAVWAALVEVKTCRLAGEAGRWRRGTPPTSSSWTATSPSKSGSAAGPCTDLAAVFRGPRCGSCLRCGGWMSTWSTGRSGSAATWAG